EVGIGRVWRPAGERNVVAARAPLDVVPEIIHLHVILREGGIVLLDQDFAQIERLPAHLDAGRGSKRADAHDRQVGVDAAVEEIEIEMTRHGSPSWPARTSRIHSLAWRGGTGATGRVPVTIDGWPLGAGILAQCCDGNEAWEELGAENNPMRKSTHRVATFPRPGAPPVIRPVPWPQAPPEA